MANFPTVTQITYTLANDNTLLMRVREKVKEFGTPTFVVVSDITTNVGEKDNWVDSLNDQKTRLTDQIEVVTEPMEDTIEDINKQITEIENL